MALPYVTPNQVKPLEEKVNNKQDALVSGVNIKTINNESILGEGNISISEGTEVTANPTLAGTEANLTGLQVGDTKYKVPRGGGASVSGINIDVLHASDGNEVTITKLTNTPQSLNFITNSSDIYDYLISLYTYIKEDCQNGYVYDTSIGSSVEADLSKGLYQGISGEYNEQTVYGLVACQSEDEYGESHRELGTVYYNDGWFIDSTFAAIGSDQQEYQSLSFVAQKSIGKE